MCQVWSPSDEVYSNDWKWLSPNLTLKLKYEGKKMWLGPAIGYIPLIYLWYNFKVVCLRNLCYGPGNIFQKIIYLEIQVKSKLKYSPNVKCQIFLFPSRDDRNKRRTFTYAKRTVAKDYLKPRKIWKFYLLLKVFWEIL